MTTELRTTFTMDVSKENETYNINDFLVSHKFKIAAISWLLSSRDHLDARISVLRIIFSAVLTEFSSLNLWLVIGDSAWQPDTRIIRHKKLFKRLSARGVEITHADSFYEDKVESDGKLKFFGAARLSELAIESVVKVMNEEPCSYIIAVPRNFGVKALISVGWGSREAIDTNILLKVAEKEGMLFKMIGAFDDPDAGYVGLGSTGVVKRLAFHN